MNETQQHEDALSSVDNWLVDFEQWLPEDIDSLSQAEFDAQLDVFTGTNGSGAAWRSEIVLDDEDAPEEVELRQLTVDTMLYAALGVLCVLLLLLDLRVTLFIMVRRLLLILFLFS